MSRLICTYAFLVAFNHSISPCYCVPEKSSSPPVATLAQELRRLHLREAVVIPYNGLYDDGPSWSPKGDALAVKIKGKWWKVDLNHVHLTATTWHYKSKVGMIDSVSSLSRVSKQQIRDYVPFKDDDRRQARLKNGTTVELKQEGFSTILLVKRKGHKSEQWWATGMENCYAPSPSPDEKYVAYIAELNGVAVMASP